MRQFQKWGNKFLVAVLMTSVLTNLVSVVQATEVNQEVLVDTVEEVTTKPVEESNLSVVEENEANLGDELETKEETAEVKGFTEEAATEEQVVEASKEESKEQNQKKTLVPLQILGINDFHGALSSTGTAYLGNDVYRDTGTAAKLATNLDKAETDFNGATLRVQAGDMVGASPANSSLLQDEPTIRVLNRMNITIGTLGNHEFDQGLGEFKRILTGQAPAPGDANYNQITHNYTQREKSKMKIVIGNVVDKNTGAIAEGFEPYTIQEVEADGQKVKVGFIGVVTTEFPNLVLKQHHEKFDVLDEATTIVKYAKELRDKGVNAIVVLGHVAATSAGDKAQGEAAEVMAKVAQLDSDNSVDAFFAGHNHQYTNGLAGKTRIVQSTSQGKAYIDLQGEIDVATGDFVEAPKATVKPVLKESAENAEVKAIVTEADEIVKSVTEAKIGTAAVTGNILRQVDENNESVLGNLITDAQLIMANTQLNQGTKPVKVDFAMTNNGGIRADLDVSENKAITWGAAQKVQPFGNILQVVSMDGAAIKEALNQQFGGKYFLQIAGLTFDYSKNGETAQIETIRTLDGKALDLNKKYNVIINDFLFGGGDGFSAFTRGELVEAIDTDTNTFVNYFKLKEGFGETVEAPKLGRKKLVKAGGELTEQEIIAATKVKPVYAGDKKIEGSTLAGATVSYAAGAVVSTTTEDGHFALDVSKASLIEGETISLVVTVAEVSAVIPVPILKAEETVEEVTAEEIIAATKVKPVYAGDKKIEGSTLAGATVSYAAGAVVTTATEDGHFALDVSKASLIEGETISLVVTVAEVSAVIPVSILKAEETVEEVTAEEIIAATKVKPVYAGDKKIEGSTLAGATVSFELEKQAKARATKAYTANDKGEFVLDVSPRVLSEGDKGKLLITAANGVTAEYPVRVLAQKSDVTVAELKKASKVNKITAGDKLITGTTLENIQVSYHLVSEEIKTTRSPLVKTDKSKIFELKVTEQELKAQEVVEVTFVAANGVSYATKVKVEAKETIGGNKGSLPKTGQVESSLVLIGWLMIGGIFVYYRRKQEGETLY